VSAPVVGVAAARLSKTLAQTSDPAAVAAEVRAVMREEIATIQYFGQQRHFWI
jgi:hypothetical protein